MVRSSSRSGHVDMVWWDRLNNLGDNSENRAGNGGRKNAADSEDKDHGSFQDSDVDSVRRRSC